MAALGICWDVADFAGLQTRPYADAFGLCVVPLADDWARRRFAIATRGDDTLTPAARLLVEPLGAAGWVEGDKSE